MAILESLIMTSCLGLIGDAQVACNKAIEAGMKQSGVEASSNQAEDVYVRKADTEAHSVLGTDYNLVAATVFVVKTASDRSVSFGLPTFKVCDKISAQVGADKSALNMEWKF